MSEHASKLFRGFGEKIRSSFVLQLIIIIFLEKLFLLVCVRMRLPESSYHSAVLFIEIFKDPMMAIALIVSFFCLVPTLKENQWKKFDYHVQLRLLIFLIAAIIAWKYSTYTYNYYYDQSHYIDRFILIFLALGLLYHPLFLAPFLFFAGVVINQFHYPLLTYSWTEKLLLFDILFIINACLILRAFVKKINTRHLIFLGLCVIGANYFSAGIKKLEISPHLYEWVIENRMHYITAVMNYRGWLDTLDQGLVQGLIKFIKLTDIPLQLLAVILELGAILILVKRRLTILALICLPCLNFMIFLVSGLFFWEWMILNMAFLVCILSLPYKYLNKLYQKKYVIASIALIALGRLVFYPVKLGWWDTNIVTSFKVEQIDDQGRKYFVNPHDISGYDYTFGNGIFCYLIKQKALTCSGAADYEITKALYDADASDISQLKEAHGQILYDPKKERVFKEFIMRYFSNANDLKGDKKLMISKFKAPAHIWGSMKIYSKPAYGTQIRQINVKYEELIFDDEKEEFVQLADLIVAEVDLPPRKRLHGVR